MEYGKVRGGTAWHASTWHLGTRWVWLAPDAAPQLLSRIVSGKRWTTATGGKYYGEEEGGVGEGGRNTFSTHLTYLLYT